MLEADLKKGMGEDENEDLKKFLGDGDLGTPKADKADDETPGAEGA